MDSDRPADPAALARSLSRAERLRLTRGSYPADGRGSRGAVGYLPPVDRVGADPVRLSDGPLGVTAGEATAFPAALALGASFDPDLAADVGAAMGAEARRRGIDALLAPSCNLIRVPQSGRTFENLSEDPLHNARTAAAVVRGIQSAGAVSVPKHYVANNQEYERVTASAEVGERALRELYLPAFRAAVEADAGAVMAAYNRVNGTPATEHARLLTDVLRDEFGFAGPVVSDWWGVRDGPAAARAGLDLEMPGVGPAHLAAMVGERPALHSLASAWPDALPGLGDVLDPDRVGNASPGGAPRPDGSAFADSLPAALARGDLSDERIEAMARRVLRLYRRAGALSDRGDAPARGGTDPPHGDRSRPDRSDHRALARRAATDGAVLLKNAGGCLPLDPADPLALVGPNVDRAKVGGGGSSDVTPERTVAPAAGITRRATGAVSVERGHPPVSAPPLLGVRLPSLPLGGGEGASVEAARSAAADAGTAVVVVEDAASECRDRPDLSLPGDQDRLVSAVAGAAERTVVVLGTAGPVDLPWLPEVDAVLAAWYPGQEAGSALAALLYGDADPGGRLPVTFAPAVDYPASTPARYPGVPGGEGYPETRYEEGVFVGYRHFDERGVAPTFPFGHGLSYADFAYADFDVGAAADGARASFSVTNTGDRPGSEVAQVYVRPGESGLPTPPRELAAFEKVALDPGETATVDLTLSRRRFASYDPDEGAWAVPPGPFTLELARSSRDVRATGVVSLRE